MLFITTLLRCRRRETCDTLIWDAFISPLWLIWCWSSTEVDVCWNSMKAPESAKCTVTRRLGDDESPRGRAALGAMGISDFRVGVCASVGV